MVFEVCFGLLLMILKLSFFSFFGSCLNLNCFIAITISVVFLVKLALIMLIIIFFSCFFIVEAKFILIVLLELQGNDIQFLHN